MVMSPKPQAPSRQLTEAERSRRRTLLAVAIVVICGAIVIGVVVFAMAQRPDPTQQWLNCLQRQINNPTVYCPPQPPGGNG